MSKIRTITTCLFAVLMLLTLSACGGTDPSEAIPAVEQTQFQRPPEDMRNFRYCEILPIFQSGTDIYVEVYATMGLNECPEEAWNTITAEEIMEEYGAVQVQINGPRFWLVNQTAASGESAAGKVVEFAGIQMRRAAVINMQLSDAQGGVSDELYIDNEVERTTTYTFLAGNMVYELTSPEGEVYRMQSYTHIVDPTLTIDDLETLGDRLDMPDGWSYEARVLTEDSALVADGLAFVLNDSLMNSYQKILEPES
ncbi:MAG: hypothetical protein AAF702_45410 [Chloroflexota bacterium]